jgi:uncharacterized protein YfaP (DUF2135 family)
MKLPALAVCLASATLSCGALAQASLDTPRGGWRHPAPSGGSTFVQPINYPASSVNTSGAEAAALISGRVASASKKRVATLVVNGVATPLMLDETGAFSRPYAFGRGSNSVEIRQGATRVRRQFFDAAPLSAPVELRVVLSWDTDATDVDLHVVSPLGEHSWYGSRETPSGGALDVDVTTGFGPEIFAHPKPPQGTWQVWVNYYGGRASGSDEGQDGGPAPVTIAQVTVISRENTPHERQQSFRVPLRRPGELTLIRSFSYP